MDICIQRLRWQRVQLKLNYLHWCAVKRAPTLCPLYKTKGSVRNAIPIKLAALIFCNSKAMRYTRGWRESLWSARCVTWILCELLLLIKIANGLAEWERAAVRILLLSLAKYTYAQQSFWIAVHYVWTYSTCLIAVWNSCWPESLKAVQVIVKLLLHVPLTDSEKMSAPSV